MSTQLPRAGPEVDADFASAASLAENVAFNGAPEELARIVSAGPRGAAALAGLAVFIVVAIWFAFFVWVFLPRGAIG
jgi:hypothetical protein